MPTLDYTRRLTNLQNRRFDKELNESALTKSFSSSSLPQDIKYLIESMQPIGDKYNAKTIAAANNVQKHLERDFDLHFNRAYRTQGSVMTSTNIKVHSDFDLLTVIDRYFYPQSQPVNPYRESDPDVDICEMRKQATAIMKSQYNIVDDKGDKCISIENQNLNRKVDIVFCYWYYSDKFNETNDDHYKGVYLYDFKNKTKHRDFPFATINNVNHKGDNTYDGFRKGVRLLKTLRADCEVELKTLKSFQLTSIAYSMENSLLIYSTGSELQIAKNLSAEMKLLINDPIKRKAVLSPNGLERPLAKDEVVPDMIRLKQDLDILIEDASKDIANSYFVQRSILAY